MRTVLVFLALVAVAFTAPSPKKPFSSWVIDRYWSLQEIYDYMAEMEELYPEITEVEYMGRTHEGREIRGLRVTSEEHLGREALPIILVTGGTQARDWISVMAALDIIHELVEHHDDFRNIVDNVEWFIIPVANPDGYEFSRTEGNRDWLKNRRPLQDTECIGVNIERNFDFNWGLTSTSNTNPCHDLHRGPAPDSEEETKTIQFAVDIMQRLQYAYITIRAGSTANHSLITYPFSSNNELFSTNFAERVSVGNIMANTMWENSGARYRVTSESSGNGLGTGTSGDYAAGRDNIPLVYTILAERGGPRGWDVPEPEIKRIVDEIFIGVEALANYVAGLPLPDALA